MIAAVHLLGGHDVVVTEPPEAIVIVDVSLTQICQGARSAAQRGAADSHGQ